MIWRVKKDMTLMGKAFARGDKVPEKVVTSIPPDRLGSLQRLGMLVQEYEKVAATPKPKPQEATP